MKKTLKKILKKTEKKPAAKKTAVKKKAAPAPAVKATGVADSVRKLMETVHAAVIDAKGFDTVVLDLQKISTVADYLVIASATNTRQVQAITDRVRDAVQVECKRKAIGIEGTENAKWVLIDFGDVICHVFEHETRAFYRLENLWHDAKEISLGSKAKASPARKRAAQG